ncbi:hypothetical protein F5887DRAFT_894582 [Amanita rubescens]|nr:hypothetical protein F5887DRAFT_894582 [Amanita rubescens]
MEGGPSFKAPGRCLWLCRQTYPLLDTEGHILGLLLGQPRDGKSWEEVQADAFVGLEEEAEYFNAKYTRIHKRGNFPSIAHGISYGGGQQVPRHLRHSDQTNAALNRLIGRHSIQRICNYASEGFKAYSRRNYNYVKGTMEEIKKRNVGLRRPYDDQAGVYPCRSFNLGKQTVSYPHTDTVNLAQSWCTISPLGNFNSKEGGQLVLWNLGLVVDFPVGSTILIPSALITHSNTSIQPDETRYSIVQYSAGGLFRWVENGFMSDKEWLRTATHNQVKEREKDKEERWGKALKMFSKLPDLILN